MILDFDPLDWAPPWRIERPPKPCPPIGPERTAWLEQRLLFQSGKLLKSVLDRVDPKIAQNRPIPSIDEEALAVALLEFLEPEPQADAPATKSMKRLPVHKARVFLSYFARGFRKYCQNHALTQPRLPLIREFSLDEGSLKTNSFNDLREYRRCAKKLADEIEHRIIGTSVPKGSSEDIAALLGCSSILFGGLTHKARWETLIATLSSPLNRCGEIFTFNFDRPTPYRWIADPVTEALLRRLWESKLLPLPKNTKLSAGAIRKLLDLGVATSAVPAHLEQLVTSAHIRHFAPDITSVAKGLMSNTPLADEPWLRLISGTRHQATRAKTAVTIPRITPTAPPSSIQQLGLRIVIEDIAAAVRWAPQTLRKAGNSDARDGEGVRKYFSKATLALRAAESKLEHLFAKAGFPEQHRSSFIYALLMYARDLLELGGLKIRQLAPSTIDNYVSIIRNHLAILHFEDLVALGTEARAEAYRENIRTQVVRDRKIHRTAFEGFERSILRHIDGSDEVDWGSIPGRPRARHLPSVDANLIDPVLYQHVLELLKKHSENHPIIELAQALLIVLYRFGLRTGEAAELMLSSLSLHNDGTASLRVSPSKLTSRKSKNAVRIIGPISLPQYEYEFLAEFRDHRISEAARRGRDHTERYLFSNGKSSHMLELVEPAQTLLIEALRNASGDPNLRPRHLRHTFVSRAFLSGRDALNVLDPASANPVSDAWWRTFSTGHASPETGINSYTHVADLAHYHYANTLVAEEVPLSFLSTLSGNDARSLERTHLRRGKNHAEGVQLFLVAARRNFPCHDITDSLARRAKYQSIDLKPADNLTFDEQQKLSWAEAWSTYSNARVGKNSGDLSDAAVFIQKRVRALEKQERLSLRLKRRPQLSNYESALAAALWQALPSDPELQRLLIQTAKWIRPNAKEILLPAKIASGLESCLKKHGSTGLISRCGPAQKRWIKLENEKGEASTGWCELIAFLYSGCKAIER